MKKALVLTCVLVFAVAAVAMAGPFDKLKDAAGKAANMPKAEKHDFALGDLDASLKGWEAGAFDPGKMSYTTYGDATWDGIATNAVKLSMAVAFGEKVSTSAAATQKEIDAAVKSLEPMAASATTLAGDITKFVGAVKSDPTKAVMLKDANAVLEQVKGAAAKVPTILSALKEKGAAAAAGGM